MKVIYSRTSIDVLMPESPLMPLFTAGDALLSVAPHNVLATLLSGGARPPVIHSPSERGPRTYMKAWGL